MGIMLKWKTKRLIKNLERIYHGSEADPSKVGLLEGVLAIRQKNAEKIISSLKREMENKKKEGKATKQEIGKIKEITSLIQACQTTLEKAKREKQKEEKAA